MAKKRNNTLFQFSRYMAIGEGSQRELGMELVQIPVAFDESNGGEIICMCASTNVMKFLEDNKKAWLGKLYFKILA